MQLSSQPLSTSETEVDKFGQKQSSHLVMIIVTVLACGCSTFSERRQQERLVFVLEEQEKHCVRGDAADGGSENRGAVKHGRCSALLDAVPSSQTVM